MLVVPPPLLCRALSCLVLSCLVLSCLVLSCLVPLFSSLSGMTKDAKISRELTSCLFHALNDVKVIHLHPTPFPILPPSVPLTRTYPNPITLCPRKSWTSTKKNWKTRCFLLPAPPTPTALQVQILFRRVRVRGRVLGKG
jgi:hypothetical protein